MKTPVHGSWEETTVELWKAVPGKCKDVSCLVLIVLDPYSRKPIATDSEKLILKALASCP